MKHIWAKTNSPIANKVIFKCTLKEDADKMILSASAFYTVFFNDTLVSYGPERTADGYSRIREIPINKKNIEIKVLVYDYGIPSLDKDFGNPFFGCEIYKGEKLVASTDDFKAYSSTEFLTNTIKFSFQRGFIERFDLRNIKENELPTYEVKNIKLIKGVGDKCHYNECSFKETRSFIFDKFDKVNIPNYIDPEDNRLSIKHDFLDIIKGECYE